MKIFKLEKKNIIKEIYYMKWEWSVNLFKFNLFLSTINAYWEYCVMNFVYVFDYCNSKNKTKKLK